MSLKQYKRPSLLLILVYCLSSPVFGQQFSDPGYGGWYSGRAYRQPESVEMYDSSMDAEAAKSEFIWIRGKYENYPGGPFPYPFGRYWWQTDYVDADQNLLRSVRRYTNIDTTERSYKALSLTDPELFEYPFVYINIKRIPLYSGYGINIKPAEAAALREYMLRGGFVLFDDFWGPRHWDGFLGELNKIFPDRPLQRLTTDHPIFHVFFDIGKIAQVPGRGVTWNFNYGFVLDNPDYPTTAHGVFDDNGRLMLLANHNTDMGDGWEHTFDQFYPTRYSNEAYKLGINFIIYALSH